MRGSSSDRPPSTLAGRVASPPKAPVCGARRRLLAGFLIGMAYAGRRGAIAAERPEPEVKAAFLFNFGKYVRWPKSGRAGGEFVIAVLGADPFGSTLDDITSGQQIDSRPVAVKRVATVKELGDCEVLYVSDSEEPRLEQILAALPKAPILTVSDIPQFSARGGMIGLVTVDRRVRFEVNLQAADRAGLSVGSQLLRLAHAVIDSGPR